MKKLSSLSMVFIFVITSTFFTGCSSKKYYSKSPSSTKYTSKARQKSTMRCYTVLGKKYNPTYVKVGQVMRGISSWYGPDFHGKYTSNGEIYNMHARTAAHKTWPMDTMVKVNNLQNGKSTIVRINDRGPFVRGRIIDCSYTAGKEIGLDKMGIAQVSIQVVGFAGKVQSAVSIAQHQKSNTQTRIRLSNFGVQVGAFRQYAGANVYKQRYLRLYPEYKTIIKRFNDVDESGEPLYRVWLMGFGSEEEARDFKSCNDFDGAFIVRN